MKSNAIAEESGALPVRPLTKAECAKARRTLTRRDPVFAAAIRGLGPCTIYESRTHHPFVSLARALTSQQLSGKAAATIFGRVAALVGEMTPANVLATDQQKLRDAGLSWQKISYLRDLSERVRDGRLVLADLEHQPDAQVIEAITAVKGFGVWSAEMFLMFRLSRPDIFPVGDLGIVKGTQKLLGMKSRPSARTMLRAAERWRPYRTVAAWYLWRILD
ncbi:MAG: DNA-3-methyladenine glycosylase [Acidobacteriota bacterium]